MTEDKTTKAAEKTAHIDYRPDIDGLRAVAVMMVVLYHAGFGFPGGFIGVDVFFVISGYLITGLIRKQQEAGTFSLAQFWHRRICRIVPAATLVVVATMIAGWFLLFPADYVALSESAIAQQLMLSNVYFWRNTGYFDGSAELKPLLHTWSLAVEEQFYLFYPFLLVMVGKASRVRLAIVLVIVFAVSLVTSEALCWAKPRVAFYLLPSRAWEMILGGLIALIPAAKFGGQTLNQTLGLLGLGGILITSFTFEATMRFPGAWALVPCVATALLIVGNLEQNTWLFRLLSLKPIVLTGQMSYSIYLWHWPILAFGRYWIEREQFQWFAAASVVATLLVSYASWRWVEQPIRKWGGARQLQNSLWRFATSVTVVAACALGVVAFQGVSGRIPTLSSEYAAAVRSASHIYEHSLEDVQQDRLPRFGSPNAKLKVLVWGDSHAMAMMPAFEELTRTLPIEVIQATHSATPPLLNFENANKYSLQEDSIPFANAVTRYCVQHEIDIVVLIGSWSGYTDLEGFDDSLQQTVDCLEGQGHEVWLVKCVPVHKVNVPRFLARQALWGAVNPPLVSQEDHRQRNRKFEEAVAKLQTASTTIIDPSVPYQDTEGNSIAIKDGKVLYRDGVHLTIAGAMVLVPFFKGLFEQRLEAIDPSVMAEQDLSQSRFENGTD